MSFLYSSLCSAPPLAHGKFFLKSTFQALALITTYLHKKSQRKEDEEKSSEKGKREDGARQRTGENQNTKD